MVFILIWSSLKNDQYELCIVLVLKRAQPFSLLDLEERMQRRYKGVYSRVDLRCYANSQTQRLGK